MVLADTTPNRSLHAGRRQSNDGRMGCFQARVTRDGEAIHEQSVGIGLFY